RRSTRREWIAWATAGVLLIALGVFAIGKSRQPLSAPLALRYTIAQPDNTTVHSFAISPDGRSVVIAAAMTYGKLQLWLRPLDALQVRPLATTDDATYPFWSPDSRYIGFFAEGKLKKVARTGGPSQSLCDVSGARGGTWSRDDVILFSQYGPG